MRRLKALLFIVASASLVSCGDGVNQTPAVTRPRAGGTEVEPPGGGFRAVAGQTIYVPAYSSIFTSDPPQNFNLAVTLSLRNTDRARPIILISAEYFDHDGKLIHDYLKKPLRIGPLAAVELFVKERDTRGGVSASFLVEWLAEEAVTPPVVESIMISTASAQGVSFISPGRVLADRSKPVPTSGGGR
jgi:hypothetical protein